MTNRHRTLAVVLAADTRDDDCEPLMDAIRRLRGVASVDLGDVVDGRDDVNRRVLGIEYGEALYDLAAAMREGRAVKVGPG